jgi:hypothetical protein
MPKREPGDWLSVVIKVALLALAILIRVLLNR